VNLRIRDLSDVSKNQSYDRSARTPAVHVSLSSDLIVKQRILFNRKAHTFNPKHLGPNLPARFSLLQENQEREEFRVSHRVSGAVDGRFIGPTNQNCQHRVLGILKKGTQTDAMALVAEAENAS